MLCDGVLWYGMVIVRLQLHFMVYVMLPYVPALALCGSEGTVDGLRLCVLLVSFISLLVFVRLLVSFYVAMRAARYITFVATRIA